jgi:hypothetical protein
MSRHDELHEGLRWLDTAAEDLRAARILMDGELNARACDEPWGHSVQKLAMDCQALSGSRNLDRWRRTASALDRFYVSTRYPNGLPDLTPEQTYFRDDAEAAIQQAEWLLRECRTLCESIARESGGTDHV